MLWQYTWEPTATRWSSISQEMFLLGEKNDADVGDVPCVALFGLAADAEETPTMKRAPPTATHAKRGALRERVHARDEVWAAPQDR